MGGQNGKQIELLGDISDFSAARGGQLAVVAVVNVGACEIDSITQMIQ